MLRTRGVGWGGGMGWDVNVHVNLQGGEVNVHVNAEAVDATHTRGGVGGGMGWDVTVHVNLQKQLMLRSRGLGQYIYIYTHVYIFEYIHRIL